MYIYLYTYICACVFETTGNDRVTGQKGVLETPFRTPFRTFSVWFAEGGHVLSLEVLAGDLSEVCVCARETERERKRWRSRVCICVFLYSYTFVHLYVCVCV